MNKIKKLAMMLIALFAISTASYAVETSIGTKIIGLGVGLWNNNGGQYAIDNPGTLELDVMVEFMPYFSLETGAILTLYNLSEGENAFGIITPDVSIFAISVPIMFRGQYENEMGVVYASVGIKAGYFFSTITTKGTDIIGFPDNDYSKDDRFSMDVAFALGYEWRLGDANYLGLRANYDLNVIKQRRDFSYDSTGLVLTYRYAFGSKWKK